VASSYGWVTIVILLMVKRAHPLYSNIWAVAQFFKFEEKFTKRKKWGDLASFLVDILSHLVFLIIFLKMKCFL
jgi:hypothetical protein